MAELYAGSKIRNATAIKRVKIERHKNCLKDELHIANKLFFLCIDYRNDDRATMNS